jgi:hypothetical protein
MAKAFNVNNIEVVELTNKLEKLHRSAMPVAVRGTLNDAAFDMKQNQVAPIFEKKFIIRKPSFIKSHTAVKKSKNTFQINQMVAECGIIKGKSQAGDELEVQEFGGTIKKREFIPMDTARTSKNPKKLVSKKYYLQKIKAGKKPVFKNQEFIRSAFMAGKGGYLVYGNVLLQIRKIVKRGRDKLFIKIHPLYSYKKGRSINLKKTPFLAPAGEKSAKKIPDFFIKRAEKQFKKYLK